MQAKLYIGSIPGNTTEQELKAHFSSVCQMVTLILVKNKHNNKTNSGFGFLTVASAADVQKLMAMDHVLGGRKIKVEPFAEGNKLKEVRSSLMRKRLYISDIPEQVTDAHIEDFFGKFGQLESAYKVKVQSTKKPCTFGYVTFTAEEPALALIKAGSVTINGYTILVFPYSKRKEKVGSVEHEEHSSNVAVRQTERIRDFDITSGRETFCYGLARQAEQVAVSIPGHSQESQHLAASKADKLQKRQGKKAQEDFELVRSQEMSYLHRQLPPFAEKKGYVPTNSKRSLGGSSEEATTPDCHSDSREPRNGDHESWEGNINPDFDCREFRNTGANRVLNVSGCHKLLPHSMHPGKYYVVSCDTSTGLPLLNAAGFSPRLQMEAASAVKPTMKSYKNPTSAGTDSFEHNLRIRLSDRAGPCAKFGPSVRLMPHFSPFGNLRVCKKYPLQN